MQVEADGSTSGIILKTFAFFLIELSLKLKSAVWKCSSAPQQLFFLPANLIVKMVIPQKQSQDLLEG